MDKTTITFRIDPDKKAALDSIASGLDRDRSFVLNEAVDRYLDLYQWQVEHIKDGLKEAQAAKFVSDAEIETFFRKASRRKK